MRGAITRDEKPNVRRKYLSPDEARRVIEAAGTIGRQPERDKLLLTMLFRHGLRLSEAIDLRWSDFDLESKHRTLFIRRLKGSKDSVHTLEPDTVRMGMSSPTATMCFAQSAEGRCQRRSRRSSWRGQAR